MYSEVGRRSPSFGQGVLGCIDANRSDQRLISKRSPRFSNIIRKLILVF